MNGKLQEYFNDNGTRGTGLGHYRGFSAMLLTVNKQPTNVFVGQRALKLDDQDVIQKYGHVAGVCSSEGLGSIPSSSLFGAQVLLVTNDEAHEAGEHTSYLSSRGGRKKGDVVVAIAWGSM